MNKILSTLALAALVVNATAADAPAKRAASTGGTSPHETTSNVIDGTRVTVTYGRPFTKDPKTGAPRKIWGGLVPYGKAWRLGSDEATTLIVQKPIQLGGTDLAAGSYTLYMVPEESGTSKLAISKVVGVWGVPVDEKNDLARVDLKKSESSSSPDQLKIEVAKNPAGGGLLKINWEDAEYSVPITVKK